MTVMMSLAVFALLVVVVLFVLVRPLWRQHGQVTDRLDVNRRLYRERAAELAQLLASGAIDAAEKQRRDNENARRLLADAERSERLIESNTEQGAGTTPLRTPLMLALALLLPLAATLLYGQLGHLPAVQAWESLSVTEADGGERNMVDMLLLLRTRLHDDPEDVEGWYLLGRSYLSLQRSQEALQAFDQARRLAPNEPDYLVAYAQTLRMAEQDAALAEVDRLLRQALQLDPTHEGARLLSAYRDMEKGRYDQAIAVFTALKERRAGDNESAAMLDQVIADAQAAKARAGGPASAADSRGAAAAPAASATAAAPEAKTAAADVTATLTVQVSLAPGLQSRLAASARVFVFARSDKGPGLPVAVAVLPANALPTTVTLSDANAMNPAVKLSDQQRVTLTARVSMAGGVEPAAGDLQGQLAAFDWRQQPEQKLVIDSVL